MKIYELAEEMNINAKQLITFFRENGYKASSHMQNLTDEMIDLARSSNLGKEKEETETVTETETTSTKGKKKTTASTTETKSVKVFKADDEIVCKSVTPWKLTATGVDKNVVYHWEYFGDVDYLKYRDLQALRRTDYITKPNILIMDEDLRSQWSRELGDTYKYFDGIDYPEEYFDKTDEDFKTLLKESPSWIHEILKVTAIAMIHAQNYPSVNKIRMLDETLGTCIKDFL